MPEKDPRSIREILLAELRAESDAEWALVMDRAKVSMELAGVQDLLRKWRHIAVAEQRSSGTHARVLAKAAEFLATGKNSAAGSYEDVRALIRDRLSR